MWAIHTLLNLLDFPKTLKIPLNSKTFPGLDITILTFPVISRSFRTVGTLSCVWTGTLWSLYLSFCVTVGPSLDFSCGSNNVCVCLCVPICLCKTISEHHKGLSQITNKGQTVAGKRRLMASCSALSRLLSSVPMKSDTVAMQVKRSEEVKRRATHWPLQTTSSLS